MRFSSTDGSLEFISIPNASSQSSQGSVQPSGFSLTKQQLLNKRRLMISDAGVTVNGNNFIVGDGNGLVFPDGTKVSSLSEINPWTINGNSISYGGNVQITGNNVLEFGAGLVKEISAGKIGYGTFDASALCIVGAGTQGSKRRIRFFNEGGAIFDGNVGIGTTSNPTAKFEVNGDLKIGNNNFFGKIATYTHTDATKRFDISSHNGPLISLHPASNAFQGSNGTISFVTYNHLSNAQAEVNFNSSQKDASNNVFYTNNMSIKPNGKVTINSTGGVLRHLDATLDVNGTIYAKKYICTLQGFADYVFNKDYKLIELDELEKFISKNNHLPNIPSEKEIIEKGLDAGDMLKLQMEKIEELTLYIINLKKEVETLKNKIK